MCDWRSYLRYDPLAPLVSSGDEAVLYFVRRDILDENPGPPNRLWELPAANKILRRQSADGSWPRSGEIKHSAIDYRLIETWRHFRYLVQQYGMTRSHPGLERAAEFLFSRQTGAGDFRGFLANQYATYYSGAVMGLLIQAGYADDPRIDKGFQWLLAMRQDDGGWTVPLLTHKFDGPTMYRLTSEWAEPVEPDRAKPFSHNWTGMIIRAFAAHPHRRRTEAAKKAVVLLKSRFFKPDVYTSYQDPGYWVRFEYPFWWNNLVAALDSLSLVGLSREDQDMAAALRWLGDHQEKSGLWRTNYTKWQEKEKDTAKARETRLWIALAVCRVLKRMYG